jgi:malate dehydrogenase
MDTDVGKDVDLRECYKMGGFHLLRTLVHLAVVGLGRIGRPTAYSIFNEKIIDEVSLVDIKPGQAWAFGEELKHVAASLRYNVQINTYEADEDVSGADLVVVCPGKPRMPGVQMDRRDLLAENAEIINYVAEVMPPNNPDAKWVVVTNPVDAMATLFKKVSGADFVISTGDHPDTLRFRAKLSMDLGVPVSDIDGFVGGEHGSAAYCLWSTVRIQGSPLDEYLSIVGKTLERDGVMSYVRGISKRVVDIIGGTEVGPASGFRDIVRSILRDRGELYSIAVQRRLEGIPEPVNVSVPIRVGCRLGPDIWNSLDLGEKSSINEAAKAIYNNYLESLRALDIS